MSKNIKNLSASVHERLLNKAREDRRSFNELLQYFAMDRFLYRWSKSPHAKGVILKGALMLRVWESIEFRSTKDIDILAKNTSNDLNAMVQMVKDVATVDVAPDGLTFYADTVDGILLGEAMRLTFENRGTELPSGANYFRTEFIEMKEKQWKAFRSKLGQGEMPESFETVIEQISQFILPVCSGLNNNLTLPRTWRAPGPWL